MTDQMTLDRAALPLPTAVEAALVRLEGLRGGALLGPDRELAARYAGAVFALRVLPLIDRLAELADEVDGVLAELGIDEAHPIRFGLAAPGPMADVRRWVQQARAYARLRAWQAVKVAR